jgi:hypothetical protein
MDMVSLADELNSLAIKDLNRFHILSIFAENNWSINSDDITSLRLARYIETNLEEIITTTIKSKWVFFTDITYGISKAGINEWSDLVSKVDATEESIHALLRSDNKTKTAIENIITQHWMTTSFYVMVRDIVHHGFEQDDVGAFFTTLKISEVYSNKARKIVSHSRFSGHYDMVRYYDEHDDNFWCDFLILDLISDGELDFNFIDESNMYVDYVHTEMEPDMSDIENFGPAEIAMDENTYDLGPTRDFEQTPAFEGAYVENIAGGMGAAYEPTDIIHINHTEIPSEPVKVDVSFTSSEPEEIKSSYDSSDSYDSDGSSDYGSDD